MQRQHDPATHEVDVGDLNDDFGADLRERDEAAGAGLMELGLMKQPLHAFSHLDEGAEIKSSSMTGFWVDTTYHLEAVAS